MSKSPLVRRLAAALVLFLTVLASASPTRSGEVRLSREDEAALAAVRTLSKGFAAAAKVIRPAVVNIKVERLVEVRARRSFNDPGEFLSQMFGVPGAPSVPRTQMQRTGGQGSGVIVDHRGYILTNNHVVGEAESIRVLLLDGREFLAELIGADSATDLAVIKINADNLTVARLGDSDSCEVGEWALAVGNPFGFDFTVTSGIISARGRSGMNVLDVEDFIQTDASINPGNSGGPLVNLQGEVIGINTVIITQPNAGTSTGINFAIPSNMAKSIMQSLISQKQVTAAYLGVESSSLDQAMAQAMGLKSPRGALIEAVTKSSPAEDAGLRRGDVVVRWGRREVTDDKQFRNLVVITPAGQPVDVEVIREGKTILLKVVLATRAPEVVVSGRGERFLQGLGIAVADATAAELENIGYEPGVRGVLVVSVERGSPAANLGFRAGSIITNVNNKDVKTADEFKNVIGALERTRVVEILWRHGVFVNRARLGLD